MKFQLGYPRENKDLPKIPAAPPLSPATVPSRSPSPRAASAPATAEARTIKGLLKVSLFPTGATTGITHPASLPERLLLPKIQVEQSSFLGTPKKPHGTAGIGTGTADEGEHLLASHSRVLGGLISAHNKAL